jgi:predicted  nucleic acid-binding Zn-ribbon protein
MDQTLQALLGLQEIDRDVFRIERELERLPAEREARQGELDRRMERINELKQLAVTERARAKEVEDQTRTQRQRIKKLENEASAARADMALQVAFQHEIRTLRRSISTGEEEALGMLERVEALAKEQAAAEAELETATADFEALSANVEAEMAEARGRLEGIARRAGRLDGDVRILGQGEQRAEVRPAGVVAAAARACHVIDQELQSRMFGRDLGHLLLLVWVRHQQPHRQPGALGRRPQPIHRAVGEPALLAGLQHGEAQSEHARLLAPGIDDRALGRIADIEEAEHPEPVRMRARRFDGDFIGVRIPARRMQQDRVHARGIHVTQGFVLGVVRHLAMNVHGRAAGPDVYLCVDYTHMILPSLFAASHPRRHAGHAA